MQSLSLSWAMSHSREIKDSATKSATNLQTPQSAHQSKIQLSADLKPCCLACPAMLTKKGWLAFAFPEVDTALQHLKFTTIWCT